MRGAREPRRGPAVHAPRAAVATLTCWLAGDRATGRAIAAGAVDRDPIAYLDALGELVTVLGDVAAEEGVALERIVADVALGLAQADHGVDPHPGGHDRSGPGDGGAS